MLEYPEIQTITTQLKSAVTGKKALTLLPPTKQHRFCFFNGDANGYNDKIKGATVTDAYPLGLFAEISFDNKQYLNFNDGVTVRLTTQNQLPHDYQMALIFDDSTALVFNVAMYGSLILHDGNFDNPYYKTSKTAVPLLSKDFGTYFDKELSKADGKLSTKAFLATNQRFVGLGNGILQDILFKSNINPKTKITALNATEVQKLKQSITTQIGLMTQLGGRDTQKDLFGNNGGYKTIMSSTNYKDGCPICGSAITKESYLGGSVYFCPVCQPQK